jgi:hypothetical protein
VALGHQRGAQRAARHADAHLRHAHTRQVAAAVARWTRGTLRRMMELVLSWLELALIGSLLTSPCRGHDERCDGDDGDDGGQRAACTAVYSIGVAPWGLFGGGGPSPLSSPVLSRAFACNVHVQDTGSTRECRAPREATDTGKRAASACAHALGAVIAAASMCQRQSAKAAGVRRCRSAHRNTCVRRGTDSTFLATRT